MRLRITTVLLALCALSPVVSAAPCGIQSLSTLIGLTDTGCTVNDKLFTNFELIQTGTLAGFDASAINVLTSTTPQGNESLVFTGLLSAVGGQAGGTLQSIIRYSVQTLSGAALIEDLTLAVGPVSELNPGASSVSATEYACVGLNIVCDANNADFTLHATPDGQPAHEVFTPVTSLSVAKQLNITAEAGNVVTLSSVTNEISQIPEPGTYALLCSGFAILALRRKYA
jgi:hypothetical protein